MPSLNTTQVFLSVRLERLLDVDDYKFKHENVATYWLSWWDPSAAAAIRERTAATAGLAGGCRRPCSNRVADAHCCDSIFLPSLYFTNADAFPEDREIGYSIDTSSNGAVVWETTVHGLYYQPLSMRNYPFDTFHLEVKLTLTDTSKSVAGHPGLQLVTSAVSLEGVHLARSRSDLTNGWNWHYPGAVANAGLQVYRFNRSAWYQDRMAVAPHASDIAPFTALNNSTNGLLDDTVQMAVLRFKVYRSFWTNQVNSNLPVYAVAILSLIVFWLPEEDLPARIELCSALFLTLIAIQFVVSDRAVARNYFTPPQLMILMTGGYILAIACESVVCFYICKWNFFKQRRKDLWQAAKERSMQHRAAKAAAAAAASASEDNTDEEEAAKPFGGLSMEKSELTADNGQLCEEAAAGGEPAAQKKAAGCLSCKARKKVPLPPCTDDYNLFVAWIVNKVCLVLALISYVIAAVLIVQMHAEGQVFRAKDALLSYAELSSCEVPGFQPGASGPCPAAALPATEL